MTRPKSTRRKPKSTPTRRKPKSKPTSKFTPTILPLVDDGTGRLRHNVPLRNIIQEFLTDTPPTALPITSNGRLDAVAWSRQFPNDFTLTKDKRLRIKMEDDKDDKDDEDVENAEDAEEVGTAKTKTTSATTRRKSITRPKWSPVREYVIDGFRVTIELQSSGYYCGYVWNYVGQDTSWMRPNKRAKVFGNRTSLQIASLQSPKGSEENDFGLYVPHGGYTAPNGFDCAHSNDLFFVGRRMTRDGKTKRVFRSSRFVYAELCRVVESLRVFLGGGGGGRGRKRTIRKSLGEGGGRGGMRVSLEFGGGREVGYRMKGGVLQDPSKCYVDTITSALMIPVKDDEEYAEWVLRVSYPESITRYIYNNLELLQNGDFYSTLTIVKQNRLFCSALPQRRDSDEGDFIIEVPNCTGTLYSSDFTFIEKLRQYNDSVTEFEDHVRKVQEYNSLSSGSRHETEEDSDQKRQRIEKTQRLKTKKETAMNELLQNYGVDKFHNTGIYCTISGETY